MIPTCLFIITDKAFILADCDNQYHALILIQGSMWSSGLVHWHLTINLRQPLIWQSSGQRPVKFCSDQYIFQFFLKIYIKINSRIWFGPVNSHFHFDWNGAHMSIICYKALKPGIHDTSFASRSPFKKTWIQVCVYTMQEILMNTHKFWREIKQTKCHFWEERRVLPFVLNYYVQLYCEGD